MHDDLREQDPAGSRAEGSPDGGDHRFPVSEGLGDDRPRLAAATTPGRRSTAVILSLVCDHGCDLQRCDVDGVVDGSGDAGCLGSAGSDEFRRSALRRVATAGPCPSTSAARRSPRARARASRSCWLSVSRWRMRAVAASRRRSSERSRRVVVEGDRRGRMPRTESLDLGSQVVLGVEPGSGDTGLAGDGVEVDPLAGGVHAPQRGDGASAGLPGPEPGGRDDVVGVVSPYRRPRFPRPCRSRRSSGPGW